MACQQNAFKRAPRVALDGFAIRRGIVLLAAIARIYRGEAIHPSNVGAVQLPLVRARLQQLQVPAQQITPYGLWKVKPCPAPDSTEIPQHSHVSHQRPQTHGQRQKNIGNPSVAVWSIAIRMQDMPDSMGLLCARECDTCWKGAGPPLSAGLGVTGKSWRARWACHRMLPPSPLSAWQTHT